MCELCVCVYLDDLVVLCEYVVVEEYWQLLFDFVLVCGDCLLESECLCLDGCVEICLVVVVDVVFGLDEDDGDEEIIV